jgi:ribosomal protein L7Ae-like RNA K-turn-binding protein
MRQERSPTWAWSEKVTGAGEERIGRAERQVLQLVGLARRAGRAVAGTQAVRDAGRRGELAAVLLAEDATDNALTCGTRETLGNAVGRKGAVVVGIADPGFARRILSVGPSGAAMGAGAALGTGSDRESRF